MNANLRFNGPPAQYLVPNIIHVNGKKGKKGGKKWEVMIKRVGRKMIFEKYKINKLKILKRYKYE